MAAKYGLAALGRSIVISCLLCIFASSENSMDRHRSVRPSCMKLRKMISEGEVYTRQHNHLNELLLVETCEINLQGFQIKSVWEASYWHIAPDTFSKKVRNYNICRWRERLSPLRCHLAYFLYRRNTSSFPTWTSVVAKLCSSLQQIDSSLKTNSTNRLLRYRFAPWVFPALNCHLPPNLQT